ncbi:cell adhesion molecule DSCAM-like isoform X2 [Brevipalpus obovatus]
MCNITVPKSDNILLIRWFKGDINGQPLYTIDGRHSSDISNGEHFVSHDTFPNGTSDRIKMDMKSAPYMLKIKSIREQDDGIYFCRIDLHWSRTMIESVRLNVIMPPTKLTIVNMNGIPFRNTAGPFNEGENAQLKCIASGGKPWPNLEWFESEKLLDGSYQVSNESKTVQSTLILYNLERRYLFRAITCKAYHQEYQSMEETVSLEMNLKPIYVKISNTDAIKKNGQKSRFTCTTFGSRPPAIITWHLNNRTLPYTSETYSEDGNHTASILDLPLHRQMDGKVLICKSENKKIVNTSLEDQFTLNVQFSPVCKENQRTVYPASIGELIDITCLIEANPRQVTFWWTKNQSHGEAIEMETKMISHGEPLRSIFKVNVESQSDFRSYYCGAKNVIGSIESLCIFSIIPQDPPAKLESCVILNDETDYKVKCSAPDKSPPSIDHILELYEDEGEHKLLETYTNQKSPVFRLKNINTSTSYLIILYSINKGGKSEDFILFLKGNKSAPIPLHISDLKGNWHAIRDGTNSRTSYPPPVSPNQVPIISLFGALSLLFVISFAIMTIVCLLIIIVRLKVSVNQAARKENNRNNNNDNNHDSTKPDFDGDHDIIDDDNVNSRTPDIIPTQNMEQSIAKVILIDSPKELTENFLAFTEIHFVDIDTSSALTIPVKIQIENSSIPANVASPESFRSTPV